MIKELNTFHSGKFILSTGFDKNTAAYLKANTAFEILNNIPVPPGVAEVKYAYRLSEVLSMMANLSGLDISPEKVEHIFEHIDKASKGELEIYVANMKKAYEFIEESFVDKVEITEELVKRTHSLVSGLEVSDYRTTAVNDLGFAAPASVLDINFLMKNFCEWINSQELKEYGSLIKAAAVEMYLRRIYPFIEYSNETARLIAFCVLKNESGSFLSSSLLKAVSSNIDSYNKCFLKFASDWGLGDVIGDFSSWIYIELQEALVSVVAYYGSNAHENYLMKLLAEKEINDRQYALLKLMMSSDTALDVKMIQVVKPFVSIYKDVSRTTAGRDITKLESMGLIKMNSKGHYVFCKSE